MLSMLLRELCLGAGRKIVCDCSGYRAGISQIGRVSKMALFHFKGMVNPQVNIVQ